MIVRRLFAALLSGFIAASACAAPITVDISRGGAQFNLGISPFVAGDALAGNSILAATHDVVDDDLRFTKIFNVVDKGPVVSKREEAAEWAKVGSEVVLSGSAAIRGGSIELSIKLFDTASGKEVFSTSKRAAPVSPARPADVRLLAHEAANDVVKYFTGQPGIFTSKIAFVNDVTGRKELYLADYDGKNPKRVTNDNSIVILPRVSHDAKKVIFTSYRAGNPDLYLMNTDGTGRRRLSFKTGLNVSPSWDPSGQQIAITLSVNGPPNIYLVDLQGAVTRHLTDSQGADTAPSFSPDGTQLAFTSDRDGAPHIWIMGLDGTGLRRITTASHCDSAAWSPDGQQILYVKGEGGSHFDIYSIEVQTGVERRLTWGEGNNENPAWSPDGRFILFTSTRRKKSELFIMSVDGTDARPLINLNGQSFTPHWSS